MNDLEPDMHIEQYNDHLIACKTHNVLKDIAEQTKTRPPLDQSFNISSVQPYVVNYRDRYHVYLWIPTVSQTLSFEEYGTGTVQAQIWNNLAVEPNTKVYAPNVAIGSFITIKIRCSDSETP